MAFQGFAREEQFSTHQINIDIASVIDSDLAEADRMSKFMAKNAQIGEKYRGMYLDALISKHKVEEDNRRRNFKFFMDNRAKIQEQIVYNNKVKMEDAKRSHPYIPSFMDMLQPALMQMAVDVGAKGIQKLFADHAAAKQEAKAKEHTDNVNSMKSIALQSNDAQQANLPALMKDWHKITANEQNERIAYHNSLGNPGQGQIEAVQIGNAAKLTASLRESIAFSPDKVAIQYQEYSRNVSIPINGRNWTQAEINQGAPNQATVIEFNALKQADFQEKIGFSSLGGTASYQVMDAIKKIDAGYSKQAYNSQTRDAYKNMAIQDAQNAQIFLNQTNGDVVGLYKKTFNPDDPTSPAARMPMSEVHEVWRGWVKNRMFSRDQLQKLWEMPGFGGGELSLMQQQDLNKGHGTPASRFMREQMTAADAENAQALQNLTAKYNLEADKQIFAAEQGLTDQNDAMNQVNFYSTTEGKKVLAGMSPTKAKELVTALSKAAGILPTPEVESPGWKFANKEFSDSELDIQAADFILDQEGNPVALSTYNSKFTGVAVSKVREAYKTAVSNIADSIIQDQGLDPRDPSLKSQVLAVLSDKQHPAVQDLQRELRAETGPPGGKPSDRYKVPKFPGLEKDYGEGAKSMTVEYNSIKADKKGPVHWKDLGDIYNHPVYLDWAETVNATIPLGGKHVQNALSNAPKEVKMIIRDQHGGSAWQGYMNGRQYGGEKYADFKPLSGADGLDFNETIQHHADMGQAYARASEGLQRVLDTQGWTPNAATRNISLSGNTGSNIQAEIASWPVEQRTNHATQAVIAFQRERARVYGLSPNPVKNKGTFNLAVREFAPGGVTSPYADDDALELHEHMPGTDHGKAGMGTMDIPVANKEQADFVINHFTKYGFRYLYGDAGHKHHVHLVLPNMGGN